MLAHAKVILTDYHPYASEGIPNHFTKRSLVLRAIRWRIR